MSFDEYDEPTGIALEHATAKLRTERDAAIARAEHAEAYLGALARTLGQIADLAREAVWDTLGGSNLEDDG